MSQMTIKVITALFITTLLFTTGCEDDPVEEIVENTVYLSSNNSGQISILDFEDSTNPTSNTATAGMDADGIYYDADADVLYQLNRTDNVIQAYSTFSTNPTVTATSTADFSNGREIAVSGSELVVAQDAADGNDNENNFYIYNISPTSITLDKTLNASINLWGIHLDGSTLYAIEDNSANLAVFENFLNNPAGEVMPTRSIEIEGIVRTHGLTYDATNDVMVLTDVGEASSDSDGAIITIDGFSDLSSNISIGTADQIRLAGAATFLGNPVDVAYSHEAGLIFVAERANGSGQLLVFSSTASGDTAPVFRKDVAGASAIYLESK